MKRLIIRATFGIVLSVFVVIGQIFCAATQTDVKATPTPKAPTKVPAVRVMTEKRVTTTPVKRAPVGTEIKETTTPKAPTKVPDARVMTEKRVTTTPVKRVPVGTEIKETTTPKAPKLPTQRPTEEAKRKIEEDEKKPAAKVEPKPVTPKRQEHKDTKPAKPTGTLDTIDIEEGGNWLIKRQIFEDTFRLIDEMDVLNTKIRDMRMAFIKSRNEIDKDVALFVQNIGYTLGKLDQISSSILYRMQQERAQEGDLSDEERSVLLSVENVEEKVKTIQEAVQEIMTLDDKIDSEILKSLEDRINESASYRQQGWKNLQEIKKMLSDEKAQNLYNKTKALYETMQSVLSWLQTKLLPYFNQTITTIRNDMSTIQTELQELASKGVDLQAEVHKIEQEEDTLEQQRMRQEMEEAVEDAVERTKAQMQETGVFAQIKAIIWYPIQLVIDLFNWIGSFF